MPITAIVALLYVTTHTNVAAAAVAAGTAAWQTTAIASVLMFVVDAMRLSPLNALLMVMRRSHRNHCRLKRLPATTTTNTLFAGKGCEAQQSKDDALCNATTVRMRIMCNTVCQFLRARAV